MTSAVKRHVSPNLSLQMFEATKSRFPIVSNSPNNNILNQSLASSTDIVNSHLDKKDCYFECETYKVDKNASLGFDHKVDNSNLQNDILNLDTKYFNPDLTDLSRNINDSNGGDFVSNPVLDLTVNYLKENSARNDQACVETAPCIDIKAMLNSKNVPNINDSLNTFTSFLKERSGSTSSSDMYQSIETLYNNPSNEVTNSKFDLREEIETHKNKNNIVNNKNKCSNLVNINTDIRLYNENNDIHTNDIKEIEPQRVITDIAHEFQRSLCPIVIVTSPSPTEVKKQLEELHMESSKLLIPEESYNPLSSTFDKLKGILKERKARNKAIENELRPLSVEHAQLKMDKYFVENKKLPVRNEGTNKGHSVEIVKLDIKPKLYSKINMEKMLTYFNKPSSSTNYDISKACNINKNNDKHYGYQNLEVDFEGISSVNQKDIDSVDQQFNDIEEQSRTSCSMTCNEKIFQMNFLDQHLKHIILKKTTHVII